MNIIVSAQGEGLDSLLDPRFGRCLYFLLINLETEKVKVIRNIGAEVGRGAGIKAANIVLKENVDVIITGNVGPNVWDILKENELKIYTAEVKKISDVLKDYKNNKLQEINK